MNRLGGLVHSQRVMLALTQAGMSREEAYRIVQENAMKVWDSDGEESLQPLLEADTRITNHLSRENLNDLFNLDHHTQHVGTIFKRVFG